MSQDTDKRLRDLFIYQVFVRNHTEEGTLDALRADLDRIRSLGVDVLYLLPFHPTGKKHRKGKKGSPYSIKDYYAADPEQGTMEDFTRLVQAAGEKGMSVMMDIVFHHTAWDSVLFEKNPGFFYEENGEKKNRVGRWWDVVDLDYAKDEALADYMIDVLLYYTRMGVDGFRFDVASLLPRWFLEKARKAVKKENPETVWLSESVHGHFLRAFREKGFSGLSEGEIYEMFDLAYDYDAHPYFENYLRGKGSLDDYIFWLNRQEEIYPENYVKLRNLENHDFGRIATLLENDEKRLENWHAFNFFQKGATMFYAGGEHFTDHKPSLFDKDPLRRQGPDKSGFIKRLASLTRGKLFTEGNYTVDKLSGKDVIHAAYENNGRRITGFFHVGPEEGKVSLPLADGEYHDRIKDAPFTVENHEARLSDLPVIIDEE